MGYIEYHPIEVLIIYRMRICTVINIFVLKYDEEVPVIYFPVFSAKECGSFYP